MKFLYEICHRTKRETSSEPIRSEIRLREKHITSQQSIRWWGHSLEPLGLAWHGCLVSWPAVSVGFGQVVVSTGMTTLLVWPVVWPCSTPFVWYSEIRRLIDQGTIIATSIIIVLINIFSIIDDEIRLSEQFEIRLSTTAYPFFCSRFLEIIYISRIRPNNDTMFERRTPSVSDDGRRLSEKIYEGQANMT